MSTTAAKRVRIATRTAGQHFGHVGEVRALNGRTVAATVETYASPGAARAVAEAIAARKGWTVVAKDNSAYRTTYHRDGTVSVWDVYRQQWDRVRAGDVSDSILATLSPAERDRIATIAAAE